jgi:isoquinoline 1-oxidoreductase
VSNRPVTREIPEDVQVTQPDAFQVMGHPSVRIDRRARDRGRGHQESPSAMLRRRVDVHGAGWPASTTPRPPDARGRTCRDGELLAVLAETDQQADAAFDLLQTQWNERTDHISQWELPAALAAEPHDPVTTQEAGDVERGLAAAEHQIEATYYIPYVPTVAMEPRAAVAEWTGDRLTVWAGTQRPFGIRGELAQHFEIPEDRIRSSPGDRRRIRQQEHLPACPRSGPPCAARRAARPGRVQPRRGDGVVHVPPGRAHHHPQRLRLVRTDHRVGLPRDPHHH